MLESRNIPYIDPTESFEEHYQQDPEDKLYFLVDRHMNKAGHKKMGELVGDFVATRVLPAKAEEAVPADKDLLMADQAP